MGERDLTSPRGLVQQRFSEFLTGGSTALFATMILGPRRGRFFDAQGEPLDMPNALDIDQIGEVAAILLLRCRVYISCGFHTSLSRYMCNGMWGVFATGLIASPRKMELAYGKGIWAIFTVWEGFLGMRHFWDVSWSCFNDLESLALIPLPSQLPLVSFDPSFS